VWSKLVLRTRRGNAASTPLIIGGGIGIGGCRRRLAGSDAGAPSIDGKAPGPEPYEKWPPGGAALVGLPGNDSGSGVSSARSKLAGWRDEPSPLGLPTIAKESSKVNARGRRIGLELSTTCGRDGTGKPSSS
jgi:hypothetical protein